MEFILVTSLWSGFEDIKCGFVDEMYVDGSVVCIMQKLMGHWILGGGDCVLKFICDELKVGKCTWQELCEDAQEAHVIH